MDNCYIEGYGQSHLKSVIEKGGTANLLIPKHVTTPPKKRSLEEKKLIKSIVKNIHHFRYSVCVHKSSIYIHTILITVISSTKICITYYYYI